MIGGNWQDKNLQIEHRAIIAMKKERKRNQPIPPNDAPTSVPSQPYPFKHKTHPPPLNQNDSQALKDMRNRDGTSSSVEGQYRGTSRHATTSTFLASLNNHPKPSRDCWGPDAAGERGGNQRRDQERSIISQVGSELELTDATFSPLDSTNRAHAHHPNHSPNHQPPHSIVTIALTSINLPMTWVEVLTHTCTSK